MYNTNSYHYQNPSRNYYGNGGQYNGHTSASNRYPSNRQDPYIQNGNSYKSPAHFNKKPYVPQYANQKSLPISKIIIQHCELISEYSETITPLELRKIFDDFIYELKPKPRNPRHMYEIAKVLIDVDGQVLLDPELRDHEFYVLIRNTIRKLLNKWYSRYNGSFLSKHEYITVYNASEILLNMVHNVSNDTEIETLNRLLLNWQLIDSIKNYLDTVSKNGKQLNDPDIDNFDIIIDVLGDYQRQTKTQLSDVHYLFALLEPIVNSICSESYMHAFRLLKPDAKALVGQQKLFLVRCPGYLTSYNGTRQEELIIRLFEIMIPRFDEILNQYVPSIKQWKAPVMRSIHHIVSMLNYGASKYQSCSKRLGEKMSIIDNILIILEEPVMINNIVENLTNQQTILINTICVFMSNIIYDSTILTYLKQKELTPRFTALTQSKNEQIRLNCQMILGYIMKEDDVTDPQKILAKVVDNLKKALNGNSTENIDVLAESLKGLVQHEQIKEEIIRENLLDLIIGCALKFTGEAKQSALETLWSMTFNEQGAEILRNNKLLISNIQALVKIHPTTPDDEGIQKAADGLLWKLQKEAELLAKLPDDEEKVTTKTLVTAADGSQQIITTTGQPVERVYQYDIMISYSWADKELCLKIHQFLIDNGYKIWLDLNNMHGPGMLPHADRCDVGI
ncbi:unnamed protein product [Didymodactylos carnosus]|uniref:TIR domain-containing protein n=1 Tax=Didymodactylos carnosus TaxID=1234261 RepID=A0A8S2R8A2_9BILA|nr:unnamed protein product [Didymodactylos carnosus]CAF4145089.1 unnamed protein product [Didymodactylos carnosus]